jgi:hypothetical protein
VTNYGPPVFQPTANPALDPTTSVFNAVHQNNAAKVATVAMEYIPQTGNHAPADPVRFWVFDQNDDRVPVVTLDSEGNKPVPGVCLSCHGGELGPPPHSANMFIGPEPATFLPFDTCSFGYSTEPGFTLLDQQTKFRDLNAIVLDTQPELAPGATPVPGSITELLFGLYGVNAATVTPGVNPLPSAAPAQLENFLPPAWGGKSDVYLDVIKPYCRTCHVAQSLKALPDNRFNLLGEAAVCLPNGTSFGRMPHAEATFRRFWEGSGRAALVNAVNQGAFGPVATGNPATCP